jgi:tyrosyl-tRNA synthetase
MPRAELPRARFEAGYNVVDLFVDAGLVSTKSEGRRLVQQGGAFVAARAESGGAAGGTAEALEAITGPGALVDAGRLNAEGEITLRAGKKRYCLVVTG